ncbi:MAG: hypothetical protein M0P12_13965 [Paludibacteraceae bacterium]|nr:hypothetical protein [Paludibacteraceae bacterium]
MAILTFGVFASETNIIVQVILVRMKCSCGGEGNMEIYSTSMLPRGRALFADLDNNYFVVTDKTSDTKTTNKGE